MLNTCSLRKIKVTAPTINFEIFIYTAFLVSAYHLILRPFISRGLF